MIGRIEGRLIEKQAPELLVDIGGVGYEIQAPMSTFYQLPELGETVVLHTHFVVREDAQLLYGFSDKDERLLFRTLIRINGVGPKMALAILSGMNAVEFVNCVHNNDTAALVKLPGVGKKTAERLIVEMRDKLKDWQPEGEFVDIGKSQVVSAHSNNALLSDAHSALVALGYKPQEASKAINAVYNDSIASSEELIRSALKSMIPV